MSAFLLATTIFQDSETIKNILLLSIPIFNFHKYSIPGDRLEYHSVLDSICGDIAEFSVKATYNGELYCKGKIKQIMQERKQKESDPKWVEAYRAWTRNLADCPNFR